MIVIESEGGWQVKADSKWVAFSLDVKIPVDSDWRTTSGREFLILGPTVWNPEYVVRSQSGTRWKNSYVIKYVMMWCVYFTGANAPTSYRGTYRVLVGIWILLDLFWFSSVLLTIKNIFKFSEEIQKPLDVAIKEDKAKDKNGQKKVSSVLAHRGR